MSLRHYPIFNGAVMAQTGLRHCYRRPKEKPMAFWLRHLVFLNGASMAQWRTNYLHRESPFKKNLNRASRLRWQKQEMKMVGKTWEEQKRLQAIRSANWQKVAAASRAKKKARQEAEMIEPELKRITKDKLEAIRQCLDFFDDNWGAFPEEVKRDLRIVLGRFESRLTTFSM